MSTKADFIFYGGDIITMSDKDPSAEALAVKGEIIIAVGKLDEVFSLAGPSTRVVNLNQQSLLPGFIEPHQHAVLMVFNRTVFTDIGGYYYNSYEAIKDVMMSKIKSLDEAATPFPWAIFFGWDPELVRDLPKLSADFLDQQFSSKFPIVVLAQSGHVAWVNHKAFEVAGVDDSIVDKDGGRFFRDDQGRLTGQLFEQPAIKSVFDFIPKPKDSAWKAAIKEQWRDYASRGFTTVTELLYRRNKHYDSLLEAESLCDDCPVRLALYRYVQSLDDPDNQDNEQTFQPNEKLWEAGVKIIADGSPHCGTAAVREPFLDTSLTKTLGFPEAPCFGFLNYSTEKLSDIVEFFHKQGNQIAIHAHGERAVDQVVSIYEQVLRKFKDPKDMRHRIEHLGLATVDAIARAGKLNLALSFFVCHLYFYAKSYTDYIFGKERTNRWTPLSEATKHGLRWTIHQDHCTFPGPPLPFANLKTAVTRTQRDDKETVYGPEYCVSIHEALKAYTINAAWQIHREGDLGSLEVNKKADLLVLSKNPYKVDPMELESIKVVGTFLNGRPKSLSSLRAMEGILEEKFLVNHEPDHPPERVSGEQLP